MIDESHYWKQPLISAATWMKRLRISSSGQGRSLVRLEREIFVGFYAIRKLLDTMKVTDATKAFTFELKCSPCVKRVDYMNCHRIDELYDLHSDSVENRDLTFLCNQFIHSYVFSPVFDQDSRVAGFYVSSDRARQKKVYFVELAQVLTAFRLVGRDAPRTFAMTRNETTGQFEGTIE